MITAPLSNFLELFLDYPLISLASYDTFVLLAYTRDRRVIEMVSAEIVIKKVQAGDKHLVGGSDRLYNSKYNRRAVWGIFRDGIQIGHITSNYTGTTVWAGPFGGPTLPPSERVLIRRGFDNVKEAKAAVHKKFAISRKVGGE